MAASGDILVRLTAALGLGFGLLGAIASANAAGCPGNPGAMGTSRVLSIDPREYPLIGTVQYQATLPLEDKEVVLTFDDGPMPPYTIRVLETLAQECVKANFFIVGRMARGYPDLLRRIHAEGHVIGTHSESHPLAFEKMPLRAVQAEIEQGFASTRSVLRTPEAVAPFFRIPGLLRANNVEQYLRSRGLVTWSADVVSDDWKHITASEVVSRSIARLEAKGKGILLLHDIQPATALALPHLLRELKRRGYKIVQVVPSTTSPVPVASAQPPGVTAPAAPTTTVTTTTVTAAVPPAPPPRERATWPVPFPATTPPAVRAEPGVPPARVEPPPQIVRAEPPIRNAPTEHTTASAIIRTVPRPFAAPAPDPAPLPARPEVSAASAVPAIPSEAAVANASPEPQPAPESEPQASPPRRTSPVPILRTAPGGVPNAASEPPMLSRPLLPAFKPSHGDAPPEKVTDLPVQRQLADPWAMRAEISPQPR